VKQYDVIIIGGGLAGLTAALDLAKAGYTIAVFEKQPYPHHKVCGEYVSNEIVPYLTTLGISLNDSNSCAITNLQLSTTQGKSIEVSLPLGGKGISRYLFDDLLFQRARAIGVDLYFDVVQHVNYVAECFTVVLAGGSKYQSKVVIGAYGKRSPLDKQLNRKFIQQKSAWLGVKAHYKLPDFPSNLVALHNFRGGYGGLSKTESGHVNFCYLVSYESFQKEKNIARFNANVVSKNPYLQQFLRSATPCFEKPLSIAQISFHPKKAVEQHVLMCGDTAGLIHPLCGNGMAMAIHSAKMAAEHIHRFLSDQNYTRMHMERDYERAWNTEFKHRLYMGRQLQRLLLNEKLSAIGMQLATQSSWILRQMIKKTHGKPIQC